MRSYLKGLLIANAAYLEQITGALAGRRPDVIAYKLTRKDVYLQSANLAAAFQRMLSEPKNKQAGAKQVHQFVVLNHILFSNIATISTSVLSQERSTYPETLLQLARKSHTKLWESIRRFDAGEQPPELHYGPQPGLPESTEDQLLKEQLRFIYTISSDIDKSVKAIL